MVRLVSVTKNVAKARRDLSLAEDLSRGRQIDLATAALAISKAEQGSTTALQRYGIIVPKVGAAVAALTHQHDLAVAAHVKFTGQAKIDYQVQLAAAAATDKQAKVEAALGLVRKRYGGDATAFAKTAAGQFQRLQQDIHQFEVAIGTAALPGLTHAAEGLGHFFAAASKSQGLKTGAIQTVHQFGTVLHDVGSVILPLVPLLGQAAKLATNLSKAFNAPAVITGLVAYKALTTGIDLAEKAYGRVKTAALTAAGVQSGDAAATTRQAGAETEAAAATTAYTEALIANTAALEANLAVSSAGTSQFYNVGRDAKTAESDVVGLSGAGVKAETSFLKLKPSLSGVSGVLKSGVAPAAVIAGYELSKLFRAIPGWDSTAKKFGSTLEDFAQKLGLVGGGASKAERQASASLSDPQVQARLAAAFKKASKLPAFARDAAIRAQFGEGFNFNDARVFAEVAARRPSFTAADTHRVGDAAVTTAIEKKQQDAIVKAADAAIKVTNQKMDELRAAAKQKTDQLNSDLKVLQDNLNQAILQRQQDLTNAISQAKSNLDSIGQKLAQDISTIIDKPLQDAQAKISAAQNRQSLENLRASALLPGGKGLSTDPQKALAQLEALQRSAGNSNKAAIQAFITTYRSAVLAVQGDQATVIKTRLTRQIADLSDSLNRNQISAGTFKKRLLGELHRDVGNYKKAGSSLGSAFQNGLTDEVQAAIRQAELISGSPHRPGGANAATLTNPLQIFQKDTRSIAQIQRSIGHKQIELQTTIEKNTRKTNALLTTLTTQRSIAGVSSSQKNPGHAHKTAAALSGTKGG